LATGKGANQRGASRTHILSAITASLKRLALDHVDLYHIHLWDEITPVEETVSALDEVVKRGYVRYVACSNWLSFRIMKAIGISNACGFAKFDGVESYYSLVGRDIERELVRLVVDEGLGLLAYSPQARGILSGKVDLGISRGIPVDEVRTRACLNALAAIAAARGVSSSRVAVAWVLAKPFVSSVVIGASSMEQLADNLAAGDLNLTDEEVGALNRASELSPEYPAWLEPFASRQRAPSAWRRFEANVNSSS
jgi:aryl-alcohol dehydrogenase-like predicted oxidoreductase